MTPFAWHRLILPLPDGWSPVKVEGYAAAGKVEFADLAGPRLAVRWTTLDPVSSQPSKAAKALQSFLRDEIGKEGKIREVTPPSGASVALVTEGGGRRIAMILFPRSRRVVDLLESVSEATESVLEPLLLPAMTEVPGDQPAPWSVFELTCLSPARLQLASHQFNVGDLSLSFTGPRRWGTTSEWHTVRQLAAASKLVLPRAPLANWLRAQGRTDVRWYRPSGDLAETTLTLAGQTYPALASTMTRRRRFAIAPWLPRQTITLVAHDARRDRLVLLHGTDEQVLRSLAATLGTPLSSGSSL